MKENWQEIQREVWGKGEAVMYKIKIEGSLKKVKLYLRDPKKALDVAIGLFYLFFCIIWVMARIYHSAFLQRIGEKEFEPPGAIMTLAPFAIFMLSVIWIYLHRKREILRVWFFCMTCFILFYPYSDLTREFYFSHYKKTYQEAARYVLSYYMQTDEVIIGLPEEFDEIIYGGEVYILTGKEGDVIFFPFDRKYGAMSGFIYYLEDPLTSDFDTEAMIWGWEGGIDYYKLSFQKSLLEENGERKKLQ